MERLSTDLGHDRGFQALFRNSAPPSFRQSQPRSFTKPQAVPAYEPPDLAEDLLPLRSHIIQTSQSVGVVHASPLTALRHRDAAALEDLFHNLPAQEIASDIHHYLDRLHPEPCWEDEPYEFLRGYV